MDAHQAQVKQMVWSGATHKEISDHLQAQNGNRRGMSERSVRRFCKEHNIHRPKHGELDSIVHTAVSEVGPIYGRRMMKGFLASKGISVAESRVAEALQHVAPIQYEHRRRDTTDKINPSPYIALYFGHKLHMDQNEKLKMYGVTHVLARDGFSGKVVSYSTMPVKNNLAIYESVYREAVTTYGLWHQLRVDQGKEFYLALYIQDQLRQQYGPADIYPYVQSPSTQNLTIERMWPEVNSRVNYPLKRILIQMEERQEIIMTDPLTMFCVSFVTTNVAYCGLRTFVEAWNHHSIPGSGVPNDLQQNSGITPIPLTSVPETSAAHRMYIAQGGRLTVFGYFGEDPLCSRPDLIRRREEYFLALHPSFPDIFSDVVSSSGSLFTAAILNFIRLTRSFQGFMSSE